jgi:CheY-like chemotaxis protein
MRFGLGRIAGEGTAVDQQKRVLVVDDNSEIRELLGSVLRQRSLTVDEARDGREAIELLREHDYAVVILDLIMPAADGFMVIEALKEERLAGSPVVLVVSGADRAVIEQLDAQLIHGIIRKPFDPAEVASLVSACAEIRGRSAFETMAIATMIAGGPLLAWLSGKL